MTRQEQLKNLVNWAESKARSERLEASFWRLQAASKGGLMIAGPGRIAEDHDTMAVQYDLIQELAQDALKWEIEAELPRCEECGAEQPDGNLGVDATHFPECSLFAPSGVDKGDTMDA